MALRASYDGAGFQAGYAGIAAQMFFDADRNNGTVSVPDAEGAMSYPRLTNGQVAALVRGWRRAAARSKSPSWPESYDLLVAALGWRKLGDRFIMTREHAAEAAPPELVALFWRSSDALAKRLDDGGTKRAAIPIDWSYQGYEAAAREAWREMQIDRSAAASAKPAESSGWGNALLLIALLIAAGMSRKKG